MFILSALLNFILTLVFSGLGFSGMMLSLMFTGLALLPGVGLPILVVHFVVWLGLRNGVKPIFENALVVAAIAASSLVSAFFFARGGTKGEIATEFLLGAFAGLIGVLFLLAGTTRSSKTDERPPRPPLPPIRG